MTCQDGKMIVTFDKSYLEDLIKNNQFTTITGEFYAQGDVNLSQLPPIRWQDNRVSSK